MKKTTFTFDNSVTERLEGIAQKKQISKSEVLRRAVTLYDFLEENRGKNSSFKIIDKDGKEINIVLP